MSWKVTATIWVLAGLMWLGVAVLWRSFPPVLVATGCFAVAAGLAPLGGDQ